MSDRIDKIRQQLSAYIDGELNDADASVVESLINTRPDVARELQELIEVRESIRSLPRHRASEGFVDEVLAKAERLRLVATSDAPEETTLPWVRYIATAAVFFIALSVGAIVSVMLWSASQYDPEVVALSHDSVTESPETLTDDSDYYEPQVSAKLRNEPGGEPAMAMRAYEMPTQQSSSSLDSSATPLAESTESNEEISEIEYARQKVSHVLEEAGVTVDEPQEQRLAGLRQVRINVIDADENQRLQIASGLARLREEMPADIELKLVDDALPQKPEAVQREMLRYVQAVTDLAAGNIIMPAQTQACGQMALVINQLLPIDFNDATRGDHTDTPASMPSEP